MKQETCFFSGMARVLNSEGIMDIIKEISSQPGQEEPFYIFDVGDIVQKVKIWRLTMPRVKMFYAVKCNDHKTVLETLAALGTGFDCASKVEMKKVLDLGVSPKRIVYAHPCKPISHLQHAAKLNVSLTTFDSDTELQKIKAVMPEAQLLLRIRCDARKALCPLGVKFGVYPKDVEPLLKVAKTLGLNIAGVAFHVGSGCQEPQVYTRAIKAAKEIFDLSKHYGFDPFILDIGGGFPGASNTSLQPIAYYVNAALDRYFPDGCGVQVIAEPGRYVVASAFTLVTGVISKREVKNEQEEVVSTMYYTNDGVYGSFNCILYDHQVVVPTVIKESLKAEPYLPCSIWGPTCDGLDQVVDKTDLPQLVVGDWLLWKDMGAYTLAAAGTFNGFPIPAVHVTIPKHTWLYLEEVLGVESKICQWETALNKKALDMEVLLKSMQKSTIDSTN